MSHKDTLPTSSWSPAAPGELHHTTTSHPATDNITDTSGSATAKGSPEGSHKAHMINMPNVHWTPPAFGTEGKKHDSSHVNGHPGSKTASGTEGEEFCA